MTVCLSLSISENTSAQTCDGYLGENIYTAGDFGSGTDNIVQSDPKHRPWIHVYNQSATSRWHIYHYKRY